MAQNVTLKAKNAHEAAAAKTAAAHLKVLGNSLRKSAEFTMDSRHSNKAQLSRTHPVSRESIESEYIKNLQQQVLLLEAEATYLRNQDRRTVDLHKRSATEIQPFINKIKDMENELTTMRTRLKRKEAVTDSAVLEKARVLDQLKAMEQSHRQEVQQLINANSQLRSDSGVLQRKLAEKDQRILDVQQQLEACQLALRATEMKLNFATSTLNQKSNELCQQQQALEERRTLLLRSETKAQQLEEKLATNSMAINDKVKEDLRTEIRSMKQKLKEMQLAASQDAHLRSKLAEDNNNLIRENARIGQHLTEVEKQLERERSLRETIEERRSRDAAQLTAVREMELRLRAELDDARVQLSRAQEQTRHFMEQCTRHEQSSTARTTSLSAAHSRLAELTSAQQRAENEISELRHDKGLFIEHVAELQRQVDDKQTVNDALHNRIHQLETDLEGLEQLRHDVQSSLVVHKLDEFGRLAETMKAISRLLPAH